VAYPISYRQLEEMMERGVEVDHLTLNRWVLKYAPLLERQFRVLEREFRARKRSVGRSWRMDETYLKVKRVWKYLHRAVDKAGATVDFLLTAKRDQKAALRFLRKAFDQHGTRRSQSTKEGPIRRRLKAIMRSIRQTSKSVRSRTSTTSSSRTIAPSNERYGQCWGSSLSGTLRLRSPVLNSCT
jgi:transposase-like protein